MAEMILPGVYIEVRPEGLIVPGRVTVGNLGVVGTAAKGPIGVPVILGSYIEARQRFYEYDPWIDGKSNELTLVRAVEQAFSHGATTVFAVRVASTGGAVKASYTLQGAGGAPPRPCVTLTAKTEGEWGNDLSVNVKAAEEDAFIEDEQHNVSDPNLIRQPIIKSARNRISVYNNLTGVTHRLKIIYDGDPPHPLPIPTPNTGEVLINRANGHMTFGDTFDPADKITASYAVSRTSAVKVTLRLDQVDEVYTIVDGNDLAADITRRSAWVDAHSDAVHGVELPAASVPPDAFGQFTGGENGADASAADYKGGLDKLLNEEAHIIVAAGQDDSFGNELDAHCQKASTDVIKRDRIAVVGSKLGVTLDELRGHNLASDRVIFVAPGIKATDAAATPPQEVTLPGAYAAAGVAGLLASFSAHISPTNKVLAVGGLERRFTSPELTQLVQSRVLALEQRQGFRIVKGITTTSGGAFAQITTRRIVDFGKFGVRSAANPYIGLLNNERVRGALRATINSFLAEMVDDEMLISYELTVTATRDEEIKGIARVTMTLRPVFSIDFIKVTMFLG